MTVEDYLLLMELNAEVYPQFEKLPDEQKRQYVNMNIISGSAYSLFDDGRLFTVGGIRYKGIGEAWMITPPQVRDEKKLSLLKEVRANFVRDRDRHNLWRIFAEKTIPGSFLEHLEFRPQPDGYVWTRT